MDVDFTAGEEIMAAEVGPENKLKVDNRKNPAISR